VPPHHVTRLAVQVKPSLKCVKKPVTMPVFGCVEQFVVFNRVANVPYR
jgi:hypothetical protein